MAKTEEGKGLIGTPRGIFKNTVALFVARTGYMLGSIVLVFFLSRMLQAEGLGSFSTVMALYGLGELACDLGLSNFIPRELAKDLTRTDRYLMHAGLLVVLSGAATALVLNGIAPYLGYAPTTVTGIFVASLAIAPAGLRAVLNAIFISHQRVEFETGTTLFWTLTRILVSLYILRQGYGVVSLIAAFTITTYCALLTSLFFYARYIGRPRWEFSRRFFLDMLNQLKSFVVLAVAGSIFVQAETVILSLFKSEAEVGYYSAAYKLITIWYIIPQSFMSVMFPILTQAYQSSSQRSQMIQDKALKYLMSLSFPLAVGGFAAAVPIIERFYGPGFDQAVLVFRVIAWHTVLAFINNVLWRVLLASNRQHLAVRVQIISGVCRIVLSFVLAPWLGALGAALALMGGYLVYTLMHIYYVRRGGIQLPFGRLGWRFALAAAVMGLIVLSSSQQVNVFLLVAEGGLVYITLVVLLRAFSSDDWSLFGQIWRHRGDTRLAESDTGIS